MDNSVKGNAAEKAMELGLDDLEAVAGGMGQETFKTLYDMMQNVSKWEQEAADSKNWEAANSFKKVRLDIAEKLKAAKNVISL
ncbi:MAG: hypothetical protein ACJ8G3_14360 [Burkholderiaceae bacterium]